MRKTLDKIVKELLTELRKINSKLYSSGSGVGLNLNNQDVKKALIRTIKSSNK